MLRRLFVSGAPALVVTATLAMASFALPAHAQGTLPKVRIVATGGTIANSPQGRMSVDDLLKRVPGLDKVAQVSITDIARVGSSAITVQNWIDIAAAVNRILSTEPDVAGIVVTHGSNTAEETAYFLSLTVNSSKPVVVTGAQRQNNTLGEEGPRNLYDAVKVAATPAATGKGVLVVVNETIHAARDVTKRISVRMETWDSGDLGALGLVDTDQVSFYRTPTSRHTAQSAVALQGVTQSAQLPRVDILYSYADGDGVLAEAAVKAGAKGLVVAGFPTGSPTPAMRRTLEKLAAEGTVVVMSHRGGLGRISTANAFISADNLTPQKARVLLMLALARDPSTVKQVFASH